MNVIDWLVANGGSVAVGVVVLAVIAAIVAGMIKNRKKGQSTCGCGCASCALSGQCHASKDE